MGLDASAIATLELDDALRLGILHIQGFARADKSVPCALERSDARLVCRQISRHGVIHHRLAHAARGCLAQIETQRLQRRTRRSGDVARDDVARIGKGRQQLIQ